ncbi:hypothetical protein HPB50_014194 [Hyalomma asiaticum]|uniref:Uncharacterized protein n=1 Tax=Hyalomma asiaticum TaxID=266040 RepID=A0ACB7RTR3_HYAAI|nr:hypothetical protein HPB50_014194 [Hyalomma asiaticum]
MGARYYGHRKDSVSGVGKGVQVFVRRRVSNGRGGNGMQYEVPIHVSNEINAAVFAVLAASSKVVLIDGVGGTIVTQTTTDNRADAAIEDEKQGLPLLSQFFAEGQVSLEEHVHTTRSASGNGARSRSSVVPAHARARSSPLTLRYSTRTTCSGCYGRG